MTPDLEELRAKFNYDPVSGALTYKKRGSSKAPVGSEAGSVHAATGYRCVTYKNVNYRIHRLIWYYVTGGWPSGVIDHIDRNRLNNAWSNLRDVDQSQNALNTSRQYVNRSTETKGVRRRGNSFTAYISHQGKKRILGSYRTLKEAIEVRQKAVEELRGE